MDNSNKELYTLYYKIIFNINKLSNKQLNTLLNKLHLLYLSQYLKNKFKDKRPIKDIYNIIQEELING